MWKPCQFDFGGLICLGSSWALGHVFIYIHIIQYLIKCVCLYIYILFVCVELRMIMYVHVYAYYYILL